MLIIERDELIFARPIQAFVSCAKYMLTPYLYSSVSKGDTMVDMRLTHDQPEDLSRDGV